MGIEGSQPECASRSRTQLETDVMTKTIIEVVVRIAVFDIVIEIGQAVTQAQAVVQLQAITGIETVTLSISVVAVIKIGVIDPGSKPENSTTASSPTRENQLKPTLVFAAFGIAEDGIAGRFGVASISTDEWSKG
ncbi:MAG: hypothetical protein DIKNOCCD_00804 [bacterium]|nr:hypothetical protein [bacterium]